MNPSNKRLAWIDQLRAFAYLMVVVSHATCYKPFKLEANSFHMPLFFLTSGLLLNAVKMQNVPLGKQFLHKLKSFGVPYLWIQFSLLPVWILNNRILRHANTPLIDIIKGIFISQNMTYSATTNPTSFHGALLFSTMYVTIVFKIARRSELLRAGFIVLLMVLGFCFHDLNLPYHINTALVGAGFVYVGYLLNQYVLKVFDGPLQQYRITLSVVLIFLGLTCAHANTGISVVYGRYGSLPLFFGSSCLTSFGIVLAFYNKCEDKWFQYLGQNTIYHLGFHMILIHTLNEIAPKVMTSDTLSFLMGFILTFGLLPFIMLINRFWPYMNAKASVFTGKAEEWAARYMAIAWSLSVPYFMILSRIPGFTGLSLPIKGIAVLLTDLVLSMIILLVTSKYCSWLYLEKRRTEQ